MLSFLKRAGMAATLATSLFVTTASAQGYGQGPGYGYGPAPKHDGGHYGYHQYGSGQCAPADDDDEAPRAGKKRPRAYGHYRPEAPSCEPRPHYGYQYGHPYGRPGTRYGYGASLEHMQYRLGRLLGMIHPVADHCRGMTLNRPVAESALRYAHIQMGSPTHAFHQGYRLGRHLARQVLDEQGAQLFCHRAWNQFGPEGDTWANVLIPERR